MSRVNAIIAATCVSSDMIMMPNIVIGVFMAPAMLTVETTMKNCSEHNISLDSLMLRVLVFKCTVLSLVCSTGNHYDDDSNGSFNKMSCSSSNCNCTPPPMSLM
jgi:hypothetical protein